ncbi:MAG: ABC transporter ATP-binding protein [Mycobacteriales bacterium]
MSLALLEVDDVTVRFGGVTAVDGARLTAEEGRVTGLIGPNGAGKTTLFNVITGLQQASGGRVRFAGEDLAGRATHERARLGIGRTFQRLEAFGSLSVWDNILAAAEIHRRWRKAAPVPDQAARELARRVGVTPVLAQQADAVPTGTARLLELARALAIEPRLLLLDEPSSGLGEEETEAFGRLLRQLAGEGMAILMVEHDMELVMSVCDHLFVLDFGRVIASGPPEEIRRDVRVQEAYLGALPPEEAAAGAARAGA